MLVLYIIPVMGTAYTGGFVPGLFCTMAACSLSAFFLLEPIHSLAIENTNKLLNVAALAGAGAATSFFAESLHRLRLSIEKTMERYRGVADNTYNWEFWLTPSGRAIYQSPSCQRITGHRAEEFIADPDSLERLVHPEDIQLFRAHRHGVVNGKTPGTLTFRIIRADGQVRWIEHFCHPVFGQDGTYLGTRGSNSDITERKRLEEVMMRTEKMMSVGGLAAGMAHEINNPLGGILQNLQNVRRRVSPDLEPNVEAARKHGCSIEAIRGYLEARGIFNFLDAIEIAGKQATRVVSKMLDFCRVDSASMVPADINALVLRTLDMCARDAGTMLKCDFSDILVETDLDPSCPQAPCVPSQIDQAVLNLLVNAAQALNETPPSTGQSKITVRTRKTGKNVRIEIEDNGPGMEPGILEQAFDPFFTTKAQGKGVGLGLSVSYYIVASHKGKLSAQSVPGQGSRFTIELGAV